MANSNFTIPNTTSIDGYSIDLSAGATNGQALTYNGTSFVATTPVGAVASVSNSDGSLTISPTTGAVVASINAAHANNWTGTQTFTAVAATGSSSIDFSGSSGAFRTSTGTNTIEGNLVVPASSSLTFSYANSSGSFDTSTGTFTFRGSVSTSGNPGFDFSGSTGTFKTSTGTNTVEGNLTVPSSALTFDYSPSSGIFKTSTGINTIGGNTILSDQKTFTASYNNGTTGLASPGVIVSLQNQTAATSGVQIRVSPALEFTGTSWNGSASSDTSRIALYQQPIQAATTSANRSGYIPVLNFISSGDGTNSGYGASNLLMIDGYGNVVAPINVNLGTNSYRSTGAFGVLAKGTTPSYSISAQGGQIKGISLATPAAPTLSTNGTAGGTSYTYYIVARDQFGNKTLQSSTTTIATGNATLTSGNSITISWSILSGAYSYDVIRSASGGTPSSTGSIALNLNNVSFTDTGIAASAYTTPARNTTGDILSDGSIIATQHLGVDGYTIDASGGASTNQVLQYNGTSFVPTTLTNTGTVTSVSAGTGMSFSTITTSGSVSIDTTVVPTRKANASETQLTTTSATNVLDYTTGSAGNYIVYIYSRIVTATTNLGINITYTDVTGSQTLTVIAAATPLAVGSYSETPVYLNCTNATHIRVVCTAGTANQVFVSATIIGVQ